MKEIKEKIERFKDMVAGDYIDIRRLDIDSSEEVKKDYETLELIVKLIDEYEDFRVTNSIMGSELLIYEKAFKIISKLVEEI